jgi:hypothetical protein
MTIRLFMSVPSKACRDVKRRFQFPFLNFVLQLPLMHIVQ